MSEMTFGERLVSERKRLGLSATDVFEAADIHRNTQSSYENDKKLPDIAYLQVLHGLGFNLLYLVVGSQYEGNQIALGSEERLLLQAYQNLPKAVQAATVALATATAAELITSQS